MLIPAAVQCFGWRAGGKNTGAVLFEQMYAAAYIESVLQDFEVVLDDNGFVDFHIRSNFVIAQDSGGYQAKPPVVVLRTGSIPTDLTTRDRRGSNIFRDNIFGYPFH